MTSGWPSQEGVSQQLLRKNQNVSKLNSLILAHGDCDGVCSASIAFSANSDAEVIFTNPFDLLSELRSVADRDVMIMDIALTSKYKDEITGEMRRLSVSRKLFYFDHHPLPAPVSVSDLPGTVIRGQGEACASELVYEYFKNQLDPEMSRVAVYGAIGDYSDDTPVIKEILRSWDKRELYLEAGILVAALEGTRKQDFRFKRSLVAYLSRNRLPSLDNELVNIAIHESQIDERMRRVVRSITKVQGKVAYVKDVAWSLGKAATYARAYTGALVGVAAEQLTDTVDMSVRSVDLNNLQEIVSTVAESLGGAGGGHSNAAGARVPQDQFMEFISGIDRAISNEQSTQ